MDFKTYRTALRHILPAYLYTTLGWLAVLVVLRIGIGVELGVFQQQTWEIWIPLILSPVVLYTALPIRLKILERGKSRSRSGTVIIPAVVMVVTGIFSQRYLSTAAGSLREVSTVQAVNEEPRSRYYRIASFRALPESMGIHSEDIRTGRHNEFVNFDIYFVCPLVDDSVSTSIPDLSGVMSWYGVSFHKQISNELPLKEKKKAFQLFRKECVAAMRNHRFDDHDYFERLPNSARRDAFRKAIAQITKHTDVKYTVLAPRYERFEDRGDSSLLIALAVYLAGTVFLIWLCGEINYEELRRQIREQNKKP